MNLRERYSMNFQMSDEEIEFLNQLKNVIHLRRAHKIKQKLIADKLQCSTTEISNIERFFSLSDSNLKEQLTNYCNAVSSLLPQEPKHD